MANNTLKEVCQLSLQDELERMIKLNMNSIIYRSLSDEEVEQLAIKIGLLPLEYRSILFFRYCFNNTPSETDRILEIENSIGKLRYIQKMLSSLMGLNSIWIDGNSMERACKIALIEDTKDYNNIEILYEPNYSRDFRQKLKDIKIPQKPNKIFLIMAKRVAIFILVCFLSFSTVLAVNAEVRERFFDWVVVTFPKFSIFIPRSIDENNDATDLKSLKINYIPNGFELEGVEEFRTMLIYKYLTDDNNELVIHFYGSDRKGKSYYDTENVQVEEFIFKEFPAFTWRTDKIMYLIWYQDGVECHVYGNLSKEEIFKIAENIVK